MKGSGQTNKKTWNIQQNKKLHSKAFPRSKDFSHSGSFDRSYRIALIVNLGILEMSYRFQTLHDYAFSS